LNIPDEHPGRSRTYPLVAEIVKKNGSLISRWGSNHNWVERARLYDKARQEAEDAANIDVIRNEQETIAQAGLRDFGRLYTIWSKAIDAMESGMEEFDAKKFNDLIRARDNLDKLGRRAARMPTTYKTGQGDTKNDEKDSVWVLSAEGPPKRLADGLDEGTPTTPTQGTDGGESTSGENQGSSLRQEMGEELFSEIGDTGQGN
jgi:hypothetical protein